MDVEKLNLSQLQALEIEVESRINSIKFNLIEKLLEDDCLCSDEGICGYHEEKCAHIFRAEVIKNNVASNRG